MVNPKLNQPSYAALLPHFRKTSDVTKISQESIQPSDKIRLVCISDTHDRTIQSAIPPGDILIHCGDAVMASDTANSYSNFLTWFLSQPHKYKILIGGNHDRVLDSKYAVYTHSQYSSRLVAQLREKTEQRLYYLENETLEILGYKFYGMPNVPYRIDEDSPAYKKERHEGAYAFGAYRGKQLIDICDKIPSDTDVVISHGPPLGHGDRVPKGGPFDPVLHVGSIELLQAESRDISRDIELKYKLVELQI